MSVRKFRDISEVPHVWDDELVTQDLRTTLELSRFCARLNGKKNVPGVHRYRSIEDAQQEETRAQEGDHPRRGNK